LQEGKQFRPQGGKRAYIKGTYMKSGKDRKDFGLAIRKGKQK
jgi:hypothetical protein